jgi:hypothetical protein
MFLGTGAYTYNPYPVLTEVTATSSAADRDGADTTFAQFIAPDNSWRNSSMLDFDNAANAGIWNYGTISLGYPKLANVGGQ